MYYRYPGVWTLKTHSPMGIVDFPGIRIEKYKLRKMTDSETGKDRRNFWHHGFTANPPLQDSGSRKMCVFAYIIWVSKGRFSGFWEVCARCSEDWIPGPSRILEQISSWFCICWRESEWSYTLTPIDLLSHVEDRAPSQRYPTSPVRRGSYYLNIPHISSFPTGKMLSCGNMVLGV